MQYVIQLEVSQTGKSRVRYIVTGPVDLARATQLRRLYENKTINLTNEFVTREKLKPDALRYLSFRVTIEPALSLADCTKVIEKHLNIAIGKRDQHDEQ